MAHDHDHPGDSVPADLLVQMGYETRDIGPEGIFKAIAILFVCIGVVSALIFALLYWVFVPQTGAIAYEARLYDSSPVRHMPPQPQIQTLPKRDIIMYRRLEKRELDEYTTADKGNIAIPVDQAIDQIAAEGISGVKEGTPKPKADAYPGSGIYENPAPAASSAPIVEPAVTGVPTVGDTPAPSPSPAESPAASPATETAPSP